MEVNKIYCGNSVDVLKSFPDNSIDCCVTSPPYYGLRDYGTGKWVGGDENCPHRRLSKFSEKTITGHAQKELVGNVGDAIYKTVCPLCGAVRVDEQIGLEETPEEFIEKLVEVFREVRRVLKENGTCWINIGDSYAGTSLDGYKTKDLIGIPWMLAFALRADGWYLRQDIIWHKTNPMPESVTDRCTKSHEYIFLLSKNAKYHFDIESIKEHALTGTGGDRNIGGNKYGDSDDKYYQTKSGKPWVRKTITDETGTYIARQKRDVWSVSTQHGADTHFATFPEKLIEPCILAGCPKDGVVLDPFMGSGTTGVVAKKNGRNYVGVDLNEEYCELAENRLSDTVYTVQLWNL